MDVELREQLESRVRGHIRRDGIDPLVDSERVLRMIEHEAAEFFLTHAPGDTRRIIRDVHHAVAGFGPLQHLFDDPTVEEIWLNEPTRVFIARQGRPVLTDIALTDGEVRSLVERMLRTSGRRLDLSEPFVDAMLPDGSRLHVAIPDVTRRHWVVNIRKFIVRPRHVRELVTGGTLTDHAAHFLDASVRAGLNVIVAGSTQAGKTTLLTALLGCVAAQERIVSCEEVFEINIDHPDWVAMQTRDPSLEGTGGIPLRRLVREALRMRPTRLIVGEVRQAEALDLLIAMNSGMPAMATIHANSAREAVTKLCTLPLLAGQNIPGEFVVPTVASAVDVVVHTRTDADGARRISEIAGVTGRVENNVVEMSTIFKDQGLGLERGNGYPPHADRFTRAGISLTDVLDPAVRRVA